jgi:two-component system sensor histidine kinase MtrB
VRLRVGLRLRVAATVAVAVLGSTVVVTYAAYELERSGTEDRFVAAARSGFAADWQQAANAAKRQATRPALQAVAEFVSQRNGIIWVVVDTRTMASEGMVDASAVPPGLIGTPYSPQQRWVDLFGSKRLAFGGLVAGTTVSMIEFYDFGPVEQQLARLRSDLIKLDLAGLAVALLLAVFVASRISRPVRQTAAAARRLGGGDLDTRVPVSGRDELADLGSAFNDMAEQLSSALRAMLAAQAQQRRFVSDVSHELRTPLAALLAATEGLTSADPAGQQRSAQLVREQTRRMNALVEDLLEISRFDAGQARLDVEQVDLGGLVEDAVRTVAPAADVVVANVSDVAVDGDARRIHAIVRNLVANAVQHGEPPVTVVIDRVDGWARVTVADRGPGIEPSAAATIFDRFARADTSRTTRSGSTGLGLAIARENTLLHGGTLQVMPGAPTRFVLSLPTSR